MVLADVYTFRGFRACSLALAGFARLTNAKSHPFLRSYVTDADGPRLWGSILLSLTKIPERLSDSTTHGLCWQMALHAE